MKDSDKATKTVSEAHRAVTLQDVANHAGVSKMTVSRVVNRLRVREDLQAKVEASLHELAYVPNAVARAARSGSLRIGMVINNPRSLNLGDFLLGASQRAALDGSQMLIEGVTDHADAVQAVLKVVTMGADGIILPPPLCDSLEILDVVWGAGIPALGFTAAEPRSHSSAVLIDDFEGARTMTRRLIALGHRDIAFIRGAPLHSPAVRREEGFRAAMAEAQLPIQQAWMEDGMFSFRLGLDAGRRLLDQPPGHRPTAIFASNDEMAAAVAAIALGLGITIPGELSIAGFDDTPIASLMWPPLTTIHQPIASMATTAVDILTDIIRQRKLGGQPAVRHHVAPFTLIERSSTGPVSQ